ncbi:unnamed protein product [Alternaria alternata]
MAHHQANMVQSNSLRRRLLQDIAEIKQDPYPNVDLKFDDNDITKACLVLTPDRQEPLHLTISFPGRYPLIAPEIKIQSQIIHPNVFGDYICATMLNTKEGWTPAYTLKGIVIQLLSFFCSDSLEQDHGNNTINLTQYRQQVTQADGRLTHQFVCYSCGFGISSSSTRTDEMEVGSAPVPTLVSLPLRHPNPLSRLFMLSDEIVLAVLTELETRDILAFAEAIPSIKTMINSYDFIRIRELQCFCLKRSFLNSKLGIGISTKSGNRSVFRSEFDLLSWEAFSVYGVRNSVQGVSFDNWLPMPLSRRHWNQVKTEVNACLRNIHNTANMPNHDPYHVDVLYRMMNTVVVQFSSDAEKGYAGLDERSTLSHASEKAVDAYFGLFHLLLCLATEHEEIVVSANKIIQRFMVGPRTKTQFPDLGHVLVAALICDAGLTEELTYEVIREAILRNVVWMLDAKGAGMAELAYLEPSAISRYRTKMTYAASPTSYRLIMFMKLFSSAARPPNKNLIELRDSMFDAHGAPPQDTSTRMAEDIREIHEFNTFPQFLAKMGLKELPSQSQFTAFLRRTITDSITAGYSIMPLTQSQLFLMRQAKEPDVDIAEGVLVTYNDRRWFRNRSWRKPSFFPNRGGRGGDRGSRGSRGGRGRR